MCLYELLEILWALNKMSFYRKSVNAKYVIIILNKYDDIIKMKKLMQCVVWLKLFTYFINFLRAQQNNSLQEI